MKRLVGVLVVLALVGLAGCAGLGASDGGDGELSYDGGGGGGDGDGGDAAAQQEQQQAALDARALQTERAIVRTGSMRLRVENFDRARTDLVDHARSLGGYVSASDSTRHAEEGESWTTGHVEVRVPAEEFGSMQSFARDRGTVLQASTNTEDVTEELVDLEARLNNSLERRERLRSFYDRADSTDELLSIEAELSDVQERIERLQGQLRSLRDRVAYSTLRVRLLEPEAAGGTITAESTLAATFIESAKSAVDTLYGIVRFGVVLAPYLVLFGLPALVVGVLLRRRYGWEILQPGRGTSASDSTQGGPAAEGSDRRGSTDDEDR